MTWTDLLKQLLLLKRLQLQNWLFQLVSPGMTDFEMQVQARWLRKH